MVTSQFQSLLKPGTLDKLRAAVKTTKKNYDEGYWKPTVDSAGNATAVLRFLPAPPPEDVGFVSYYRHAFEGPNGWYIELSRNTMNEPDPVVDFNSRLWKTDDPALKDLARKQARKLTYVSNVYVIQDKGTPANEGKVFLFRYGKRIFEKIRMAATGDPEFPDDPTFDPFHLIDGANFRLRQKKQAGFPNYDDSAFEAQSPFLRGNEAAIFEVMSQAKSLAALVDPTQFLPYGELKKKLDRVMGFDTGTYLTLNDANRDVPSADETPAPRRRAAVTTMEDDEVPVPAVRPWTPPTDDDDDVDARLSKFDDD